MLVLQCPGFTWSRLSTLLPVSQSPGRYTCPKKKSLRAAVWVPGFPLPQQMRQVGNRPPSREEHPLAGEGSLGTLAPPSPPFPLQLAPEHTLMSFRKALEQKLYGLQADVTIRLAWSRRTVATPPFFPTASAFGSLGKTLLSLP